MPQYVKMPSMKSLVRDSHAPVRPIIRESMGSMGPLMTTSNVLTTLPVRAQTTSDRGIFQIVRHERQDRQSWTGYSGRKVSGSMPLVKRGCSSRLNAVHT